jgi:hypothetical protein
MMGLAKIPGMDVLPIWWRAMRAGAKAACRGPTSAANLPGQAGSGGATTILMDPPRIGPKGK